MAEEEQKKETAVKKKKNLLHRIVNIFLYIGISLLLLLIIIFGISQTSAFKEYLREIVLEEVNSALNGKVYIEKIEGTIFTSLLLRNAAVTMDSDTLLKAESIEVKTSPLRLLLKNIYIRKFELKNASVSLIKDRTGEINFARLFPPAEEDTSKSEFPFTIQVADFKLTNVNFSLRDYRFSNSNEEYKSLNSDNLMLKNVNLSLNAFANIKQNQFALGVNKFSLEPNISSLNVKNISGGFYVDEEKVTVRDLNISTERSEIDLNMGAENFNLFDTTGASDIADALITLDLQAHKFSFDDLAALLPSTDILSGTLSSDIKAIGTLKDLNLKQLDAQYFNTRFSAEGRIRNIDEPSAMIINAQFENMQVDQSDINRLLPSLSIPVYEEYGLIKFDTLQFAGHPINFSTKFYMNTGRGNISATGKMNFQETQMSYDLNIVTEKLDISPIAGMQSDINSQIYIIGKGTAPEDLTAEVDFNSAVSSINGYKINSLKLNAAAAEKKINYKLDVLSDSSNAELSGLFDFTTEEDPAYELKGHFNKINIAEIVKDSSVRTNLNFKIDASGENFDPEEMNLFLTLNLFNSTYNKINIDSTRAILDLRKEKNGERIINFISDLADITVTGNFNIPQTAELISEEIKFMADAVNRKMDEMIPSRQNIKQVTGYDDNGKSELKVIPAAYKDEISGKGYFNEIDSKMDIKYAVDLKDFRLLSMFLGKNQLEIDGDIEGSLESTGDSIYFSLESRLPYIKFWGTENVFFLSNMNLDLSLTNGFSSKNLTDIFTELKFKTDRIFTGSDIYDVNLNLELSGNNSPISFSGQLENYASVKFQGDLNLNGTAGLNLDSLILTYNELTFRNKNRMGITLSPDRINFENFSLARDSGEIRLNGSLSQHGSQNFELELVNIDGKELCIYLLNLRPENSLNAKINLTADVTGSLDNPEINLSLNADSIGYKGRKFGSLVSTFNYRNKNLHADTKFINTIESLFGTGKNTDQGNILLEISGNIPVDLSMQGKTGKLLTDRETELSLKADNFNLAAFGDVLPSINRLEGILSADLKFKGMLPDNISPSGYLEIKDGAFIAEVNNLEYQTGFKIKVEPGSLLLENLYIQNTPDTKGGGQMRGSGKLTLEGFEAAASEFSVNGRLKVLSEASKSASPSVYGDLVIATNGNVLFRSTSEGAYLEAPMEIVTAKLTFPPSRSAYTRSSENFIYKYAVNADSLKKGMDFDQLVKLSRSRNETAAAKPSLFDELDYKIDIKVEDEAAIIFVLSKEFNQNLTAILSGDFELEKKGGRPIVLGELKLLEGSTLEFIKTLEAEGSIKFENEIDNPILNITATYTDYYSPDTTGTEAVSEDEILVAVKIKLEGPLKELDKKLIQGEDNILVYVGEKAIENDEPDRTKDASDAVMFMIMGKFRDEATQQEIGAVQSYAASVAGSVVGSFLNNKTNGVIKSVEFRQTENNTYVNFGGKFGKFTYEFGTTTESFNDLSQANFKIKYPITKRFIGRVERKRALNETSLNREMVNEIGLRYRFEF